MMKRLVLAALLLTGCDLYFGGGGGDDVCNYGTGGGGALPPAYEVRDPNTGVCQYQGGGYPCDGVCGPCEGDVAIAQPDWGACYGHCSGLDEAACFTTSGCYAAYLDDPAADGKRDFWGCWETAPSGPIQGQCSNLDAQSCSRHDDCIAIYSGMSDATDTAYAGTKFLQCAAEPTTYCTSNADCGADAICDTTQCYPDPNCPSCPTCGACPDVCYGVCIPKDPMACDVIDCGPGYHCDEQCYGDPMMQSCQPVCVQDITCASVDCGPGYTCAQTCTTGTNGQVTCYPTCQPDPAACATLTSEAACVARMDCIPVYDGQDCTCYPDHCECQVLTYERCEAL
jgi:hypothetical protein